MNNSLAPWLRTALLKPFGPRLSVYFHHPPLAHGRSPRPRLSEISTRPSDIEAPNTRLASAFSAPLNSLLAISIILPIERTKRTTPFADTRQISGATLSTENRNCV